VEPTDFVRIVYGTVLLTRPGALLASATGDHRSRGLRVVARLLGARHVVQGVITALVARPAVRRAGVRLDLAHAGTDVLYGMTHRRRVAPALLDAIVALSLAAGDRRVVQERARRPQLS
jgi:hypothetical protein